MKTQPTEGAVSAYATLLETIGGADATAEVVKAMPTGDAMGGEGTGEGEGEEDADKVVADAAAGDGTVPPAKKDDMGPEVGKSFVVVGEDGAEREAFDATEILKALNDKVGNLEELGVKVVPALAAVLVKHGEMMKSMREELTELRSAGRGRARIATVTPPAGATPPAAPEAVSIVPNEEFWGKCFAATEAGKLSHSDVRTLESYVSKKLQPPEALATKVARAIA